MAAHDINESSWLYRLFPRQTDPTRGGAGPLLKASEVGNPMTGDFTVADDVSAIAPIIVSIGNRFAEYEASGSDAWDSTMDVRTRPDWCVTPPPILTPSCLQWTAGVKRCGMQAKERGEPNVHKNTQAKLRFTHESEFGPVAQCCGRRGRQVGRRARGRHRWRRRLKANAHPRA